MCFTCCLVVVIVFYMFRVTLAVFHVKMVVGVALS